ncbi:MAG: hypothetical protein QXN55_08585 [Candidatus Nitrosotenuis sp.]
MSAPTNSSSNSKSSYSGVTKKLSPRSYTPSSTPYEESLAESLLSGVMDVADAMALMRYPVKVFQSVLGHQAQGFESGLLNHTGARLRSKTDHFAGWLDDIGNGNFGQATQDVALFALNTELEIGGSGALAAGVSKLGTWGVKAISELGFWDKAVESTEKTVRYTEIASGVSKAEARAILKENLELTPEQRSKLLTLLSNGRMDKINIKLMNTGEVRLSVERAGVSDGYQRMSFGVDQLGNTNKVVQTAFDKSNVLVRQNPGEAKNNLYDVKKWNTMTY